MGRGRPVEDAPKMRVRPERLPASNGPWPAHLEPTESGDISDTQLSWYALHPYSRHRDPARTDIIMGSERRDLSYEPEEAAWGSRFLFSNQPPVPPLPHVHIIRENPTGLKLYY